MHFSFIETVDVEYDHDIVKAVVVKKYLLLPPLFLNSFKRILDHIF